MKGTSELKEKELHVPRDSADLVRTVRTDRREMNKDVQDLMVKGLPVQMVSTDLVHKELLQTGLRREIILMVSGQRRKRQLLFQV